jgi:uncharacterized protein YkwD
VIKSQLKSANTTMISRRFQLMLVRTLAYGYDETRNIVTALLIDDGVPSRGHRTNLLNGRFNVVGVGVGLHQVYRHMCVMDFAGSYDSK